MACWKIQLNDITGKAVEVKTITAFTGNKDNFTWKAFFTDLMQSDDNYDTFMDLKEQADEIKKQLLDKQRSNHIYQIAQPKIKNALELIQLNLSSLGVKLEIVPAKEMQQRFGLTSKGKTVTAGVDNGIIYVSSSARVTEPIHELMHLVLGVMKVNDYNQYQFLMEQLSTAYYIDKNGEEHYIFKELFDQINSDSSAYKDNMESDKMEEAFCRVIEQLLNKKSKINFSTFQTRDGKLVFDLLDEQLIPFINLTFGTKLQNSAINFLSSIIQDLPLSSDVFTQVDIESNGYLQQKKNVITAGKVLNYINQLLDQNNPKLIEGECE